MQPALLLLLLTVSLILLSKGSDWLTDSLVPIAKKLNTSNVSVGLILVSFVVSLPEILVAVLAAWKGYHTISLGVAIGSIICNIGLMTGLAALIRPLRVTRTMILRDGVISLVIPILVFAMSKNGVITRLDGLAMFLLFFPYLINVFLQEQSVAKRYRLREKQEVTRELALIDFGIGRFRAGWVSFLFGVSLLLFGSYLLSDQLILLVQSFHLDPVFVGITLGALIPSIPNIAAALDATSKGLTEVAVSETIGSNIFTLLVTLGVISMLSPTPVASQWLYFDIPVMMGMSMLLLLFMITGKAISRVEGFVLFSCYMGVLIIQTLLLSG